MAKQKLPESKKDRRNLMNDYIARCRKLLKLLNKNQSVGVLNAIEVLSAEDLVDKSDEEVMTIFGGAEAMVHAAILEKGGATYANVFAPKSAEDELELDEAAEVVNEMLRLFQE